MACPESNVNFFLKATICRSVLWKVGIGRAGCQGTSAHGASKTF